MEYSEKNGTFMLTYQQDSEKYEEEGQERLKEPGI